jgi:hypothetical protein
LEEKGEIEMKKYTLAALQMAYLPVTMKDQEGNVCLYCWENKCSCTNNSVETDAFINLTTVSEFTLK